MRCFVATWFFPPSTSAEGLVAYKLLKNSQHQYDVCSSLSKQWSYKEESTLGSSNIHSLYVNTDDIDVWVTEAIRIFEDNNAKNSYDFIMTRCMPPESLEIGLYIKRKYPSIKWIASFGDPISKNPYELQAYIIDNHKIIQPLKTKVISYPNTFLPLLNFVPDAGIRLLNKLNTLESKALKKADLLVFPSADQCRYSLAGRLKHYINKCLILPHSYDIAMYPKNFRTSNEKLTFTYIGYADNLRSPKWFIRALKLIKDFNPKLLEQIHVQIIGNIPSDIEDMVYAFFLHETVSILPPVNYKKSLEIMCNSDWLLHVDARFNSLPNSSIFFASKIADYIGAGKPILALTESNSTAYKIVTEIGGIAIEPDRTAEIALAIVDIIKGSDYHISEEVRNKYDAVNVSTVFDSALTNWTGNLSD